MVQGESERVLGLLLYITQLRPYDHFVTRLPGFYVIQADRTSVKIRRAEQFFRISFEEHSTANIRSIARYFRVQRLRGQNKTRLLRGGDRGLLRYGNQLPCDEFSRLGLLGNGPEERQRNRPWRHSGGASDTTEI